MADNRVAETTLDRDGKRARQQRTLAAQIQQVRTELTKWNRGDVLGRHRIGQSIKRMLNAPGRYGQRIIPSLVEAVGFGASWFYECQMVADTWTEAELGKLLSRRDAVRGLPLNWSHLVLLATLTDGRERRKWINEALREGLTATELKGRLNRPPDTPADEEDEEDSPDARQAARWLRDIRANAEATLSKQRQWQSTLLKELAEQDLDLDAEEAEATLETARKAKEGYETLIERLEQAVHEMQAPA